MSKEQDILRELMYDWRKESGAIKVRDAVVAHVKGDELYVVTAHPGFYIGKCGELSAKYTDKLKELGIAQRVHFVDTNTSYVCVL